MKPLRPAFIPQAETELAIKGTQDLWEQNDPAVRACFPEADRNVAYAKIRELVTNEKDRCAIWKNELYTVAVYDDGPIVHLSIKRNDRQVLKDWRDFQAIKNQLVGPECEGIELYPAESRMVDTSNQYHLWVFKDPTYKIPIGFGPGRIVTENSIGKSRQRPFK